MNARKLGTGPVIEESTNIEDLHHRRLLVPPDECYGRIRLAGQRRDCTWTTGL